MPRRRNNVKTPVFECAMIIALALTLVGWGMARFNDDVDTLLFECSLVISLTFLLVGLIKNRRKKGDLK